MKIDQRIAPIRAIWSDVDGVLTSGGITYDNQGIETKTFHVRDGLGNQTLAEGRLSLWHHHRSFIPYRQDSHERIGSRNRTPRSKQQA